MGVEVEELVSAGVPLRRSNGSVLFDGTAEPGEIVRGRLLAYYAYTHSFQINENVAVLVGSFDADLGLQLLPLADDVVQLQWGKRPVEATLAELVSPECPSLLMAKYEPADADRSRSHSAAAPSNSMCPP